MKIKLLLVLNNVNWLSIKDKLKDIRDFFAPKFVLEIDVRYVSFKNVPYEIVQSSSMINNVEVLTRVPAVEKNWYNKNITSLALDKQIVLFYAGDQSIQGHPAGIQQDNNEGPVELTVFKVAEHDRLYQQGVKDIGDAFSMLACHEISHALKKMFNVPDDTHYHFYQGNPRDALNNLNVGKLDFISIIIVGIRRALTFMGILINEKLDDGITPVELVFDSTEEGWKPEDVLDNWNTPEKARHSSRVIMDEYDLTWTEKDILCAVIMAESGFKINAKNENKVNGKVVSTDWGLLQINDFYHIGAGKSFKSVDEVLNEPEKSVRFLVKQYKAGNLNWWIAFRNKNYLKFLS